MPHLGVVEVVIIKYFRPGRRYDIEDALAQAFSSLTERSLLYFTTLGSPTTEQWWTY